MRKCKWSLQLLLAALLGFAAAGQALAAAPPEIRVEARSAILMEATTGEVVFEQNADEKLPPASVTKVMTLLLAMEAVDKGELSLAEKVPVSPEAARMGGSQIWLKPGEDMTSADMLKAIAIVSANDACYALAERLSGSVEAFVARMNQRARQLNLRSTTFVNCTGLSPDSGTGPGNITSARDVAIMSRELLKHPSVLKWTGTWIDHLREGKSFLRNTNRLVRFFAGCDGLKTGFTREAGFCLSATARRNNVRLIAVVMNTATDTVRAREISKLLNLGFAQYQAVQVVKRGQVLAKVPVRRGVLESIDAVADTDHFAAVRRGAEAQFVKQLRINKPLVAPLRQGQQVGVLELRKGDELIETVAIVAAKDVARATYGQLAGQVMRNLFGKLFGGLK